MDQAITLKEMVDKSSEKRYPRTDKRDLKVISVTSGKGGVGKTNVVANLAFSLTRLGKKVLVLDTDMGLGNLDVILGLTPVYNLHHVINGDIPVSDAIIHGPGGMMILPASSGVQELSELTSHQKLNLLSELDKLEQNVDVMLIDTAAGISSNVMYFNTAAQEIMVVVSPEPASITDAYAVMKVLHTKYGECHFKLLVNMVKSPADGKEVYRKLSAAADRFLNISIDYMGAIVQDKYVRMSIMEQRPVVDLYPWAEASKGFLSLARAVCDWPPNFQLKGNIQFMWKRLMQQSDWSRV